MAQSRNLQNGKQNIERDDQKRWDRRRWETMLIDVFIVMSLAINLLMALMIEGQRIRGVFS